MRKKLGCLHAHYSNIKYIENALSPFDIELVHFVDPGLIYRVSADKNFQESDAQVKVKEQIEWIARCNVDAILITCTNYIALLQEKQLSISVPIIKMDEPFFGCICSIQEPQVIIFTNPETVEGTMNRLNQYANNHQKSLDLEAIVIKDSFDLLMRGLKEEYNREVSNVLYQYIKDEEKYISVAQLSMVDASQQVEANTSITIMNPLTPLISSIINQLGL